MTRGIKVRAQREGEEKAINLFTQHLHSQRIADREGERGPFLFLLSPPPFIFGSGGKIENALDAQLGLGDSGGERAGRTRTDAP